MYACSNRTNDINNNNNIQKRTTISKIDKHKYNNNTNNIKTTSELLKIATKNTTKKNIIMT